MLCNLVFLLSHNLSDAPRERDCLSSLSSPSTLTLLLGITAWCSYAYRIPSKVLALCLRPFIGIWPLPQQGFLCSCLHFHTNHAGLGQILQVDSHTSLHSCCPLPWSCVAPHILRLCSDDTSQRYLLWAHPPRTIMLLLLATYLLWLFLLEALRGWLDAICSFCLCFNSHSSRDCLIHNGRDFIVSVGSPLHLL